MENNFQSQAQLVETIWADKATCKANKITKTSLLAMSAEDLTALAESLGIDIAPIATPTVDLSSTGVTSRNTLNGQVIYTIDLPLVHTDGFSFHFQNGDKIVVIAGDLQLAECFEQGLIAIGDNVPFHYHGADTWKPLSQGGNYLIPNNSGDRAREHASSGTIAKSFFAPIANLLAQDKLAKAKNNIAMMKIAKDTGLKMRQLRSIDREDRVETARAMLQALRGK